MAVALRKKRLQEKEVKRQGWLEGNRDWSPSPETCCVHDAVGKPSRGHHGWGTQPLEAERGPDTGRERPPSQTGVRMTLSGETENESKGRSSNPFNLSALPFPKCFLTESRLFFFFFYTGNSQFELQFLKYIKSHFGFGWGRRGCT